MKDARADNYVAAPGSARENIYREDWGYCFIVLGRGFGRQHGRQPAFCPLDHHDGQIHAVEKRSFISARRGKP